MSGERIDEDEGAVITEAGTHEARVGQCLASGANPNFVAATGHGLADFTDFADLADLLLQGQHHLPLNVEDGGAGLPAGHLAIPVADGRDGGAGGGWQDVGHGLGLLARGAVQVLLDSGEDCGGTRAGEGDG